LQPLALCQVALVLAGTHARPNPDLPLDEAHPSYVLNTLFDLGSLLKLRRLNQRCLASTELTL